MAMGSEAPTSLPDESPAPGSTSSPSGRAPAVLPPPPPVTAAGLPPPPAVTPSAGPKLQSSPAAPPPPTEQDASRANFAGTPYAVPSPPISYSVLPRGGSGGTPAPVPKLLPSMPPAALQPPVPGQYFGSRPSFSYNVVSHPNASHHTGQQFQLNTAVHQASRFIPPASLQPPGPGQIIRPHTGFPRSAAPGISPPVRFPLPNLPLQTNQDFSTTLQPTQSTHLQNMSPHTANMESVSSKSGASDGEEISSQSNQSSSVLLSHAGIDGVTGDGKTQGTAMSGAPRPAASPAAPLLPAPAPAPSPVSVLHNSQYHFYPSYPTGGPSMVSPSHPVWLNPPPLQPYTASILPSHSPMPITRAAVIDSPLLNSQSGQVAAVTIDIKDQSISGGEQQTIDNQKQEETAPPLDANTWTVHKTDTGLIYYYNSLTGESTYQRPATFKGEIEKVTASQSIPTSWEKLAGTDWTLVTTNDGKKYYYDNKSKVSSWQLPPEVAALSKNPESASLNGSSTVPQEPGNPDNSTLPTSIPTPAVETGGRDPISLREVVPLASTSALDLIKKKLHDNIGATSTSSALLGSSDLAENGSKPADALPNKGRQSEVTDKPKDLVEGNESDLSSESDDDDQGPSKEECIVQFKEMLKERGVLPFAKWDKELPKLVFDPRFQAVPSYSRRAIFEHYVKTRAEEERKEKKAAQKAAIDAFKQLLEDASEDIDKKSDYQEFKRKWGSDSRFQALDRREREILFNEKVKVVQERVKASQAAVMSDFKLMLREGKDVNINSRWTKVKENFRSDPRYKAVNHDVRETLFNEFLSELKSAEDAVARAAKVKLKEQEKLKERERELRKRKEREEQEMERVKLKIRRKEAVSSYQALLVEMIKDPKASWTECKPKLEKDPQGRATNPDLSQGDAERLFRDHVKDLLQRSARDYRTLLSEIITAEAAARVTEDGKTVLTSWTEAKKLLKADPRYTKLPSKDRESLWRRHTDDMMRKQKQEKAEEDEKKPPNPDKATRK